MECSDTSDDEPDDDGGSPPQRPPSGDDEGIPASTARHIFIDPRDSCEGLNPLYLRENPHTFEPQKYQRTGIVEAWGTSDEWMEEEGNMMGKMQTQMMYGSFGSGKETPEQQFVGILKKRKQKRLMQEEPDRAPLYPYDFVLRIALVRGPADNDPDGYQEFQVRSS